MAAIGVNPDADTRARAVLEGWALEEKRVHAGSPQEAKLKEELQEVSRGLDTFVQDSRPLRRPGKYRAALPEIEGHAGKTRLFSNCYKDRVRPYWALFERRDGSCARSREIVAGWTLNRRAASPAVLSPRPTIMRISACCCGESLGRRPPTRPCRRAASIPARVRSRSIARAQTFQEPVEFGPVPPAAGGGFTKNERASRFFQRVGLRLGVLVLGRHARITDQHCINISPIDSILQYHCATPKSLKTRGGREGCTTAPFCNSVRNSGSQRNSTRVRGLVRQERVPFPAVEGAKPRGRRSVRFCERPRGATGLLAPFSERLHTKCGKLSTRAMTRRLFDRPIRRHSGAVPISSDLPTARLLLSVALLGA